VKERRRKTLDISTPIINHGGKPKRTGPVEAIAGKKKGEERTVEKKGIRDTYTGTSAM